jgi:hypothetical protein
MAATILSPTAGAAGDRPRLSLAAIAAAALVVTVAAAGLAAPFLAAARKPAGPIAVLIGKTRLAIPAGDFAQPLAAGMPPASIELALAWPGMGTAIRTGRDGSGKPAAASRAGVVLISLRAADETPDPGMLPGLLYGRFLDATVWNYPGDLIARRFKETSPYAGEELVMIPPDGTRFWARCPIDSAGAEADSSCLATFRRRGIDIAVSFDRAVIRDAAAIREQVLTYFERIVR